MRFHRLIGVAPLALAGALSLAAGGCRDTQGPRSDPTSPNDPLLSLIVSDPVPDSAALGDRAAAVVYASLPPGSVPGGASITLQNRRSGAEASAPMVAGGVDPLAVAAAVGDTLEVHITVDADVGMHRFFSVVPARRPPVVVRVDPPSGQEGVSLDAAPLVVFSEPIDATTLSATSVALSQGGAPVPGRLSFGDAAHLTLQVAPNGLLAAGAEHRLLLSQAIRDLSGDALPAQVTAGFTTVTTAPLAALIVSNPSETPTATNPAGGDSSTVYVSLPPWSIPDGERIVIRSRSTGWETAAPMMDGGVDPILVSATAGDTLDIRVDLAGNRGVRTFISVVPERRPPVVVRTSPPPGRRDVPLNAMLLVVFSEPIDPGTVSPASVQLLRAGLPVAGTLEFGDTTRLTVILTPAESLAAGVEYTLVVTQAIQDRDGNALERTVTGTFTTGGDGGVVPARLSTYERVTPSSVPGASRLVFYENGRYSLQAQWPEYGFFESLGSYAVSGGTGGMTLTFDYQGIGGTWTAAVTSQGDSLVVRHQNAPAYPPIEDGVYRLSQAPAPSGDAGGRIAFASDRDGVFSIYVADPDGANLTRLAEGLEPAWSWDSHKIAYTRFPTDGGPPAIGVMDADGSNQTVLGAGRTPAWSPDGSQIAFSLDTAILVMQADGSNRRELINLALAGIRDGAVIRHPTWSPDGRTIAFDAWGAADTVVYGYLQVHLMDADGSNHRRLGQDGWSTYDPNWSADGAHLEVQTYDLDRFPDGSSAFDPALATYDVSSGGRTIRYHTHMQWLVEGPDRSPDGRYLAFSQWSVLAGGVTQQRHRILVLDVTTGAVYPLTSDAVNATRPEYIDRDPAWSRN